MRLERRPIRGESMPIKSNSLFSAEHTTRESARGKKEFTSRCRRAWRYLGPHRYSRGRPGRWSNGYSASGYLLNGDISIH